MSDRVQLRVMPRASKNAIEGVRDGRLVVRITAPPVDGAANAAAVAVVARALGVPPTSIHVVAGHTSRNKTVTVDGWSAAHVLARIRGG